MRTNSNPSTWPDSAYRLAIAASAMRQQMQDKRDAMARAARTRANLRLFAPE